MAVVTGSVLGLLPVSVPSNAIPVPLPGGGGDPAAGRSRLRARPPRRPGLPGTAEVGQLIVLTDPVWNLPGVTTTYQWLRDGVPIPGPTTSSTCRPSTTPGTSSAQVTGLLAGIPALTVITDALPVPLPGARARSLRSATWRSPGEEDRDDARLTGPTWDPADATSRYQWLRDNAPIRAPPPRPTRWRRPTSDTRSRQGHRAQDRLHRQHHHQRPGHAARGRRDLDRHEAPDHRHGRRRATAHGRPGQWSGGTEASGPPDYSYQWLRGGAAIPGAVAQTYQVDKADVGRDLAVLVTATRPAYKAGKFTTAPVTVAKLTLEAVGGSGQEDRHEGKAAMLRLVLRVPSMGSPTGDVTILDKKSTLTQKAFTKGRHGRLVVKLSGLAPACTSSARCTPGRRRSPVRGRRPCGSWSRGNAAPPSDAERPARDPGRAVRRGESCELVLLGRALELWVGAGSGAAGGGGGGGGPDRPRRPRWSPGAA